MATYDTTVRVGTSIDRKGTEVQLMALENQITKKADKIASLMSKMGEMKDAKLPTQEYKEITLQIEKAEQNLNRLIEKQDQMQREGKTNGAVWDRLLHQIDETKNEIKYAKGELQDLVDTGKAFTLGQDTEEYAKMGQQVQYLQNELSVLAERHDLLTAKQRSAADAYKQFKERGQAAFHKIGGLIKKANDNINAFGRRLKEVAQKHLPLFRRETERTKTSLSGFSNRLKSLLSGIFIFNAISAGFRQMFAAIRDGYKNLYNDNEKFQSSVDNLKASLTTLKNALAAAFSPIVETAIPYIQRLVDWLTEAVNMIGQLIAALTGRKTYTRAIRQTAEASKEAADATDEETDAMNRQLSPLDKMNVVTSQKDKNKDKGKEDGDSFGIMFEEVPIDSNILDFAEKIKDILANFFAPLKEAWDREGAFVIESWKYALNEVWELIKDIGRDFLEVWNQEATIKIFQDILHIIGDIGLVVGHLARNFREAWNENDVGLHILENIRDIIGIIVKHIRNAADATVEWADKLDFYPLLDASNRFLESLEPAVDALAGALEDFYTKVMLPFGKWTLEKGLPELLQVFIDFNNKVDWESLRANLAQFWEHLEPFAETVVEGLILFIERVSDALADFLNSQEFKDFLIMIEDWMDNVTPEDVADALEKIAKGLIALKLALLGFSVISALASFLTFLGSFGGIVAGGAKMVASGISAIVGSLGGILPMLAIVGAAVLGWNIGSWIAEKLELDPKPFSETMEEIKSSFTDGSWKEALKLWGDDIYNAFLTLGERQAEKFNEIKNNIAETWNNIKESSSEKWREIKKRLSDAWSTIKENAVRKWNSIKESISSVISNIKDKIDGFISKIQEAIQSVKDFFSSGSSKTGGAFKGNSKANSRMSAPSFYTAEAAIATLDKVEIPAYATGQVIPRTMKQHLAILGDNNKETEIVSPLSTIKQALREEAIALGLAGGNGGQDINLNLTVKCGEYELIHILQKIDREYLKQHGKHVLA